MLNRCLILLACAPALVAQGTLRTAPPVLGLRSGTHATNAPITLTCPTPGAVFRYTLDGTDPTPTTGTLAVRQVDGTVWVQLPGGCTLKVLALAPHMAPSEVVSGTYAFQPLKPVLSVPGGRYDRSQVVQVTHPAGATVTLRYTLDGSDPTPSSPEVVKKPGTGTPDVHVDRCATLKVRAFFRGTGWLPSPLAEATYTLQSHPPRFGPNGGTFSEQQRIRVAFGDSFSAVHYTTDGSEPTPTSKRILPIDPHLPLEEGGVLSMKAFAPWEGWKPSETVKATFVFRPEAPALVPAPGKVAFPLMIQPKPVPIAGGWKLRYTLDGSEPGPQSPEVPWQGINLLSPATLKVRAFPLRAGWQPGLVATGVYAAK